MIYETDTDMVALWNGSAWRYIAATTPTNGTVLQVQSTHCNTQTTSTSASFVDISGMSVSITPRSSSSKMLVQVKMSIGHFNADDIAFNLLRNGSDIAQGTGGSTRNSTLFGRGESSSNYFQYNCFIYGVDFLDSPATTSALTYKMQWYTRVGTITLNRRGGDGALSGTSSITVMEIAA
jgi:hypothetical protein